MKALLRLVPERGLPSTPLFQPRAMRRYPRPGRAATQQPTTAKLKQPARVPVATRRNGPYAKASSISLPPLTVARSERPLWK